MRPNLGTPLSDSEGGMRRHKNSATSRAERNNHGNRAQDRYVWKTMEPLFVAKIIHRVAVHLLHLGRFMMRQDPEDG